MRLFGTDGIRGVAGRYPLDGPTVRAIGAAAAKILKRQNIHPLIIMGRDTRESGAEIAAHLAEGFSAAGIEVWDLGIVPTPGVAYMVQQYPALAGIVISASHNPYQDNGIKFFSPKGTKLPDHIEELIEQEIARIASRETTGVRATDGRGLQENSPLVQHYAGFLQSTFPDQHNLQGIKLVIDCANGATCAIASEIFSSMGAEVTALNAAPDGRNINLGCGALHPERMAGEVLRHKGACGLAFDGDGDRIIFADENGEVRDGDYLLAIAASFLKEMGRLKNNTLVATVMSNLGLFRAMEQHDINVRTTAVGDRYVFEEMVRSKAVLGGEQSGHIIFRRFLSTGDGILSALQILSIMKQKDKPLSALCGIMRKYPQVLLNTRVSRKIPLESLSLTSEVIKGAERKLKSDGRILVRYSGTENLLRVMVEGAEKKVIHDIATEISEVAKQEINKLGKGVH